MRFVRRKTKQNTKHKKVQHHNQKDVEINYQLLEYKKLQKEGFDSQPTLSIREYQKKKAKQNIARYNSKFRSKY
ncbi:MAG: hypothetical protein Q8K98_01570 [Bacteroidota bacterium]|nr:hypothetical protein [Bacteroidota bacterium]